MRVPFHPLTAVQQIRTNTLSRVEKAKVIETAGVRPPVGHIPKPAATAPVFPLDIADAPDKNAVRRHRIVENVARKAIFGLPKLTYDDELDDPVQD